MTSSTSNNTAMINPMSADACKNGPSHRRARSIIREFSLNTSTHGIPGIARSQSILNRIFWAISTLIFADCYKEDFIAFSDARYGNCYTFNAKASQIRNGTVYKLSENGDWGFLELELYVHSQQYVPYWSPAMGMIVQIHDNEQIPLMHWKGHYLIPGRRQRLTFTRKTQYRLPKPYSDCDTKVPYMLQVAFDHFGNASYTYEQYICATVCIQVYM
ncbi:unnamed protein product [Adineta steineri]|uniref:Uncharacterized protein n=1 Tax=Adineta steineri TaxID=433720 RepID=A0A814JBE7_9BILA|nr:unnamed protein product [Adineta steineri]